MKCISWIKLLIWCIYFYLICCIHKIRYLLFQSGIAGQGLSSSRAKNLRSNEKLVSKYNRYPRPISRHKSDLSWRIDLLKNKRAEGRSESISSAPDASKTVMLPSQSTLCLKSIVTTSGGNNYSVESTLDYIDKNSSDGSESNSDYVLMS